MRKDLKVNRMIGWEKTNSKKLQKIERKISEEKLSNLLEKKEEQFQEKKSKSYKQMKKI